jgi:molybdopterin-guanine dinucleotide biosynthesis protein A
MGSAKAELQIAGRPILHYLLDRMNWPGPTMLVIAADAPSPPGSERFDRCVHETVSGVGPLQGVFTALQHATTPTVVVAAIDMPAIGFEHLSFVANHLIHRPELAGVLLARSEPGTRRIEPFPSCYRTDAARVAVEAQLVQGGRAIRSLLGLPEFVAIDAPAHWTDQIWINLNTPQDLERFNSRSGADGLTPNA